MITSWFQRAALGLALAAAQLASSAAPVVYLGDRAGFLDRTGASSVGAYPASHSGALVVGNLSFNNVAGSQLTFGDFSNELPGNELGVSGLENFDIVVLGGLPIYAAGFSIYEPAYRVGAVGCNAVCFDAVFQIQIFSGTKLVGSYLYNAPDDGDPALGGPVGFFGVHSSEVITKITVRDTFPSGVDNEFFDEVLIGQAVLSPVSEPAIFSLLGIGLAGLAAVHRLRLKVTH